MDNVLIVKANEVLRLSKFRRIWVVGWMVATAALVVAAIQTVRIVEYERQERQIAALVAEVERVQAEQKAINDSYVRAWQNQQQTADLLVTWGTYVKERTEMATNNLIRGSVAFKR